MDNPFFRPRAQGALDSERIQLLSIIARHWDDLDHHDSLSNSPKQKWDLWDKISEEFNTNPNVTVTRTPVQLKTLFKNMKTKAKKYKLRLETSKVCGVMVESDPVSELVLQLTTTENQESLKALVDSLQNLSYIIDSTNIKKDERETSLPLSSPASVDTNMVVEFECIPEIKEEETSDPPTVTKENDSVVSHQDDEPQILQSSDNGVPISIDPEPRSPSPDTEINAQNLPSSEVIMTPVASEEKEDHPQFTLPSSITQTINSEVNNEEGQPQENLNFPSLAQLQTNALLNLPMSLGFLQLSSLIHNNILKSQSKTNDDSIPQNSHSPPSQSTENQTCQFPHYHEQMLLFARKEHELRISLLNEEIMTECLQRKLHEEQLKYKEQNFLLKQEERRVYMAEHEARMKLIELEFSSLKDSMTSGSESIIKTLFQNGSKEI